jgi:penicillin amidase
MRKLGALLLIIITIALVWLLDRPIGPLPALGRLLDPANGAWANAEPVNRSFDGSMRLKGFQNKVDVWFDERLVPHIRAANDHDLYMMQGYIHAAFRLFQMDLQTRAAAGRVSEVIGEKGLKFDREQRRKGMVYGAEQSLKAISAEPRTKAMLDAYAAGVNLYISQLSYRDLPIEYKLINFTPEKWTNIKTALLLKYMADDLTGKVDDIPLTVLRKELGDEEFNNLFPERQMGSTPVIPAGTAFQRGSLNALQAPPDSIAFASIDSTDFEQEEDGKGSNNWAVSGARTQSGAPILCNDPHLGLNLPSLWYEVQLQAPGLNVYGVSLPGAPGVIIGFNENIAWGFTNNYRDVKDFYAIQSSGDGYVFEGKQLPFEKRVEEIRIKGGDVFYDTVLYTLHGPVMYDENFHGPAGLKKRLATTWMAHKGTNELLSVYLLNRSRSYDEFVNAILHFQCPAQNMLYADKTGNIALWGQGQFVNKWKGQGVYVMNGADSATLWQQLIPMRENPHVYNPPQGFISSANQTVTDSTYPYWYNGTFYEFRAWRINQVLSTMNKATVQDMFALQNDNYSFLAATVLPHLIKQVNTNAINNSGKQYLQQLSAWDYRLEAESTEATLFQIWWSKLYQQVWKNRLKNTKLNYLPSPELTMQYIIKDTAGKFYNAASDTNSFSSFVTKTYNAAIDSMKKLGDKAQWYHVKNTSVTHLAKLPAFSYKDIKAGGWGNAVNAMKENHGPSWRMVVQMTKDIDAYGVYPGGQSGNPGSKYYANFIDNWSSGKYYKLVFLAANAPKPDAIKYTLTVKPR